MEGEPSDEQLRWWQFMQQEEQREQQVQQAAQLDLDVLSGQGAKAALTAFGVLPAMQLTSRQQLLVDLVEVVARQGVSADSVPDLKNRLRARARGELEPDWLDD